MVSIRGWTEVILTICFLKSPIHSCLKTNANERINYLGNYRIAPGIGIKTFWNWCKAAGNDKCIINNWQVFKRGIATLETEGKIDGYDGLGGGIKIKSKDQQSSFTLPGDSGAIVFVLDEEWKKLFPLGLHYSGNLIDGISFSYCIPFWKIIDDFMTKNEVSNVNFNFNNPKSNGEIKLSK